MALSIDCRSHTVQRLPDMPVPMSGTVADVIDGRIYIIGDGGNYVLEKVMVVFDTKSQKWESRVIKPGVELGDTWSYGCVVMADKLYTRDDHNSFVYEPKECKWETDEMLNFQKWRDACVVDDVLYSLNPDENYKLRAYDPAQKCWRVVKGLEKLLSKFLGWPYTVSYGGKLALFFQVGGRTTEICVRRFRWKHIKEERFGELFFI
ncbi:F-box/kelch-repeat protein At4g38940-like [Eutrema salsugineum]|uniref:F-box/kelch-repeat protein At4g38940-like n=1 Tax=Eutrema salsugineum TaxID=72664 RepID=UPI000CED56D0|nr:F-box/kelch-repeat protein At4g38940-like [Eutrema salsugineum]